MIMEYKQIRFLDDLKELAKGEEPVECFVRLQLGFRSSKRISFKENDAKERWWIVNEIDDSEETFITDEDMLEKTIIGKALKYGALFQYGE